MTGQNGQEKIDRVPRIYHGAAGLGSRDVRPGDIIAAVRQHDRRRPGLLLRRHRPSAGAEGERTTPTCGPRGGFSMRGHSVGGFGSVTTNKVIATIAGDVFGKDVQAYPEVRLREEGPADDVLPDDRRHAHLHAQRTGARRSGRASTTPTAMLSGDPLKGLVPGGAIFMQSPYTEPEEVWKRIPASAPEDDPREEDPRLLLRHGEDRPRGGLARPTCKCACRASCCWARS